MGPGGRGLAPVRGRAGTVGRDTPPVGAHRQATPKREGVPIELADLIIRVLDMCHHLGIDLPGAIAAKLAYNRGRGHLHDGKKL